MEVAPALDTVPPKKRKLAAADGSAVMTGAYTLQQPQQQQQQQLLPHAETDEELARRLHEELNAGMTRLVARRTGSGPVLPNGLPSNGHHMGEHKARVRKGGAEASNPPRNGKHTGTGKPPRKPEPKQEHKPRPEDDPEEDARSRADGPERKLEPKQESQAGGVPGPGSNRNGKHGASSSVGTSLSRKRSTLNRELQMLVSDLVDSHLRPVAAGRPRNAKEEHEEEQHPPPQQQHKVECKVAARALQGKQRAKSDEELERDDSSEDFDAQQENEQPQSSEGGKGQPTQPVGSGDAGTQQQQQHGAHAEHAVEPISPQKEQHGAQQQRGHEGGGSKWDSGATSNDSSNAGERKPGGATTGVDAGVVNGAAHGIAFNSGRDPDAADRSVCATGVEHDGTGGCCPAAAGMRPRLGGKIPKLPMVEANGRWYRAKLLQDQPKGGRVLLEYQGFVGAEGGPFWLARNSSRIWRGSYKGRDWKYLGQGAWEPKSANSQGALKKKGSASHRGKGTKHSAHRPGQLHAQQQHDSGGAAGSAGGSAGGTADEATERGGADGGAATIGGGATTSGRDTSSTDQRDGGAVVAAASGAEEEGPQHVRAACTPTIAPRGGSVEGSSPRAGGLPSAVERLGREEARLAGEPGNAHGASMECDGPAATAANAEVVEAATGARGRRRGGASGKGVCEDQHAGCVEGDPATAEAARIAPGSRATGRRRLVLSKRAVTALGSDADDDGVIEGGTSADGDAEAGGNGSDHVAPSGVPKARRSMGISGGRPKRGRAAAAVAAAVAALGASDPLIDGDGEGGVVGAEGGYVDDEARDPDEPYRPPAARLRPQQRRSHPAKAAVVAAPAVVAATNCVASNGPNLIPGTTLNVDAGAAVLVLSGAENGGSRNGSGSGCENGGSPRENGITPLQPAHRRKGVPQRARMTSEEGTLLRTTSGSWYTSAQLCAGGASAALPAKAGGKCKKKALLAGSSAHVQGGYVGAEVDVLGGFCAAPAVTGASGGVGAGEDDEDLEVAAVTLMSSLANGGSAGPASLGGTAGRVAGSGGGCMALAPLVTAPGARRSSDGSNRSWGPASPRRNGMGGPRGGGGGRRRGHNWSKPLRPPRVPMAAPVATVAAPSPSAQAPPRVGPPLAGGAAPAGTGAGAEGVPPHAPPANGRTNGISSLLGALVSASRRVSDSGHADAMLDGLQHVHGGATLPNGSSHSHQAPHSLFSRSDRLSALFEAVGELRLSPQLPALPPEVDLLPSVAVNDQHSAGTLNCKAAAGPFSGSRLLANVPSLEQVHRAAVMHAAATAAQQQQQQQQQQQEDRQQQRQQLMSLQAIGASFQVPAPHPLRQHFGSGPLCVKSSSGGSASMDMLGDAAQAHDALLPLGAGVPLFV